MPTLRKKLIAKRVVKPQNLLYDRAIQLAHRNEATLAEYNTALAEYNTALVEYNIKRRAAQEAALKKEAKPKLASQPLNGENNRDGNLVNQRNVAGTSSKIGIREDVEAPVLPFTKRERQLLNRLNQKNLSPEERQKILRTFDQSRHLQELQQKRAETKRLNREANAAKKKKNRLWIVEPSAGGSSMFGGVKYSYVYVWQGGLPGLGKRR